MLILGQGRPFRITLGKYGILTVHGQPVLDVCGEGNLSVIVKRRYEAVTGYQSSSQNKKTLSYEKKPVLLSGFLFKQ